MSSSEQDVCDHFPPRRLTNNASCLALFLTLALAWTSNLSAFAKQVGEALTDMGDVQGTDPNGYMLMMISIGLLFTVAAVLIGVTTMYMFKSKKGKKKDT